MNLIYVPFAFDPEANSSLNFKKTNKSKSNNRYEIYLKNSCVSLVTAKRHNPECEVAFVTNLEEVPYKYKNILEKENIKIFYVKYDTFVFPNDYVWSLAFYKLNALYEMSKKKYDNICYIDSDVFIQGSFEMIWDACSQKVLLYDISHGVNPKEYKLFNTEISAFVGNTCFVTHYGGEFYASSTSSAQAFCSKCLSVYKRMIELDFKQIHGDEFILSVAALEMNNILNAGLFIFRFWTANSFRLVSTVYKKDKVLIIHVPSEKERGMVKLFDKYIAKGMLPGEKKAWKILKLTRLSIIGELICALAEQYKQMSFK